MQPLEYKPTSPDQFIGPAAKLARLLTVKATQARSNPTGTPIKILLTGKPGGGKSSLAIMLANLLAGHPSAVHNLNGQQVTVERVSDLLDRQSYRPMCPGYAVTLIDEIDAMPTAATGFMRTLLDKLGSFNAVVATSNAELKNLPEALQSRFQWFAVARPNSQDIAALLKSFGLNGEAQAIADRATGNVRAALLDAQSVLDARSI